MEYAYNEKNFNGREFVILFTYILSLNGVKTIPQNELEEKLYPYRYDKKYEVLFNNIFLKRFPLDGLNLSDGITDIKYSGLVKWMSDDENNLDITGYIAMKDYIEAVYPPEFVLLMQELVDEYILRTVIEKDGRYKLNIYGLNPNTKYTLSMGSHECEHYSMKIITDGGLVKDSCYESPNKVYCPNPRKTDAFIGITDYKQRNIIINDASFVIEQSSLGSSEVANLYTMTNDIEQLKLLADYATRSYSPYTSDTITSTAPYVFSLKPKNIK